MATDAQNLIIETELNVNLDTTKIPLSDIDAWKMYPKFRWVYETTRLLDIQNIRWSPFLEEGFTVGIQSYNLDSPTKILNTTIDDTNKGTQKKGFVFIEEMQGDHLFTDAVIQKGEVKWLQHFTKDKDLLDEIKGNLELKINAITTLHFQKFSGVINVETIGQNIIAIRLRMTQEMVDQYPENWIKKVLRVYNRRPWGKK